MNSINLSKILEDILIPAKLVRDAKIIGIGMSTSKFNQKGYLSFLSDEKYLESLLNNSEITSAIVKPPLDIEKMKNVEGLVLCEQPKTLFFAMHEYLTRTNFYWEHFENEIDSSAMISDRAYIAPKNVKIGKNCLIEQNVNVLEGSIIGDDVIIRSGSTIASTGFQFNKDSEGNNVSVSFAGRVVIKNHVEIQHNTCVDRGVFGGDTVIGENVKIDNLVHVAHDVVIGKNTLIAAGSILGGRLIIGSDCWIGINSTIANGLTIGDHASVSMGAAVTKNVDSNQRVTGNFAIEHSKFIENLKKNR